jgi:hypothetical protein
MVILKILTWLIKKFKWWNWKKLKYGYNKLILFKVWSMITEMMKN